MLKFPQTDIYWVILKLIILAGLGFFLQRRKILNQENINFLTTFLIKITLPSLIFVNLIENFTFENSPPLFLFLGLSLIIFLTGVFGGCILVFLTKEKILSKEIISLISFQNCGYLPMNIIYFLFPSPEKERLLNFTFLYILGFNILMWSVGSFLIFKKKEERFKLNSLLNPPVLAILLALGIKKFFSGLVIPQVIISPLKMLGQMSFVVSILVLGAGLSQIGFLYITKKKVSQIISISIVKLFLIPFLFFIFIAKFKLYTALGFFIILQACMPSAVSLPIITKQKQADYKFSSQVVFFTHIFSLITIPFWLKLFLKYSGYG
ncbi:MAG: hypothetical protein DRP80_06290 [Candidatus Omnitrophota bacterium]|nr:MAG: hypothetical protein DRP80_06290 [Candidatus Omnitrophota bacterium]